MWIHFKLKSLAKKTEARKNHDFCSKNNANLIHIFREKQEIFFVGSTEENKYAHKTTHLSLRASSRRGLGMAIGDRKQDQRTLTARVPTTNERQGKTSVYKKFFPAIIIVYSPEKKEEINQSIVSRNKASRINCAVYFFSFSNSNYLWKKKKVKGFH